MPLEKSPIRVLHVIESLETGGAEGVVMDLVNHATASVQPTICCLKKSGPMASRLCRNEVEILDLGKSEGNDYGLPCRLAQLLRERRIDVLQGHNWATFLECAVAGVLAGTPVRLQVIHGEFRPVPQAGWKKMKHSFRNRVENILSPALHAYVAVSDGVKEYLLSEKGLSSDKVHVIRNGIPVTVRNGTDRRRDLGVDAGGLLVVAVGRLVPVKNFARLIRSFGNVVRQGATSARLMIVGDGPERPALLHLIQSLGLDMHVQLAGERADARAIVAAADVFVLPSLSEGVSVALLEAMAGGRAVLATRTGGTPEIIEGEKTGILVEPDDGEGLARALTRLFADRSLRERLGQEAARRAKDEFGIGRTVEAYENLYQKLLGRTALRASDRI